MPGSSLRRPRSLIAALALLIGAGVLWLPVTGYLEEGTLLVLLLVLHFVFAIRATGGRHRARVTVTVVDVLLCILMAPYLWLGPGDADNLYGTEYAVVDAVAIAAACVGVALLYLPATAASFRRPPAP